MAETKLNKWGYDIRVQHFPRKKELVARIRDDEGVLAGIEGEVFGKRAYVDNYDIESLFKGRGHRREMSDVLFWALEDHLRKHGFESVQMFTNQSMAYFLKKHRGWSLKSRDQFEDFDVSHDLGRVRRPRRWSAVKR